MTTTSEYTEFEGQQIETDLIGFPTKVEAGVRCGKCQGRHQSAAAVKLCYFVSVSYEVDQADDFNADMAYERHLENRGADEAYAQDAYERQNGVIGFREAWHNASPETCPCCNG